MNDSDLSAKISKVAIIGSGTMGSCISKLLISHNVESVLIGARDFIADQTPNLDYIRNAELIIESSSENLKIKSQVLYKLSEANSDGIIASTTSSLSILNLSESIIDPSRFCGVHFMNPATVIRVVEFTTTAIFSNSRKVELTKFLNSIDRNVFETPDQPGFVLNALLFPFLNRAIFMLESSNLEPKVIDHIMMKVCGHKLGPLSTLDLIGLDVSLEILNILHDRDPYFNLPPSNLLKKLVQEKRLGKKTGSGFYNY